MSLEQRQRRIRPARIEQASGALDDALEIELVALDALGEAIAHAPTSSTAAESGLALRVFGPT